MSRPNRCVPSGALVNLSELYEKFTNKKSEAHKYFNNPKEEFKRFVEMDMGVDIHTIEFMARAGNFSKGDVRTLSNKLDNILKSVREGNLKGVSWLYVPASFAKIDPTIRETLQNYQAAGHHTQARGLRDQSDLQSLYDSLRLESESRAAKNPTFFDNVVEKYIKRPLGKTPQQKMNNLTKLKRRAIANAKAGKQGAAEELTRLTRMQDELIKDTHLGVHNELLNIIETKLPAAVAAANKIRKQRSAGKKKVSPENQEIVNLTLANENFGFKGDKKDIKGNVVKSDIRKEIIDNIKNDDGSELNDNMIDALTTYIKVMDRAHTTLVNGVKAKIDMLSMKTDKNLDANELKSFRKTLEDKLIPDYESGFFPHYIEDLTADFWGGIMPLFDDLNMASNQYQRKGSSDLTVRDALNNINSYISGHAKKRVQTKADYKYSPNFFLSVTDYLHDINKFNFISFVDKYQAEAVRSVERSFKKTNGELNGYASKIMHFITDMHNSAIGKGDVENPHLRGLQRTLLGFEFASKMGISIRSAVKNGTQKLIDYIQWDRQMNKEANEWWEREGRPEIAIGYGEKADINQILEDLGIGFSKGMSPELMESGIGRAETKVARFDENGKIKFTEPSKMEDVAGIVGNIGSSLTGMHRAVENHNRAGTFKIGYYQMWKWLDNKEFYKQFESTAAAKREIHKRAQKYALFQTVAHHFDYNDFSKAKWMTSAGGKLVGQFQHFAFSFYELTNNFVRRGKNDLLEGEVKGHNALKMYRYGTVYFLAPVLAAMATGIDITRLLDNPYVEVVNNWYKWIFGDEEEQDEAFYGKGPVMGTLGAPALGTILKAGELMQFIDLDEDSVLGMMAGYRDSASRTGDDQTLKTVKLLNVAAGRALEQTIPSITRGNIGWALQSELGLYPSAEARDIQKQYGYRAPTQKKSKIKKRIDPVASAKQNMLASLSAIQKKPKVNKYDQFQRKNIMNAFELIRKQQQEESDIYNFDNNRKMTIS